MISTLFLTALAMASRPIPAPCKIKAKVASIDQIAELTVNGASVEMAIDVTESSCAGHGGRKLAKFYWDPKARFKHRLEKLGQTNSEITKVGVLKAGTQIEAVMDSYDSTLSELNGVKLPAP
jgi:hypothetical protein